MGSAYSRALIVAAFVLLGSAAIYASLLFLNESAWAVNATLPPVAKDLNSSIYPLARAWWQADGGYNVTYYYIKFMPGWPELYTVGVFQPRYSGWSARLQEVAASGNPGGTFAISLGGQPQITPTQTAGTYVPTPAQLVWSNTATQRYSILAYAWFNQGGITALQLVNFTA
ncbi:MAG: hypothetical protein ABWJ97_04660, partial [Thermoproteus sp.]